MIFTNKEIELAKQMKNMGLEWDPEIGDWFYVIKDTKTGEEIEDWWLCCDVIHSDDEIILYSWNGNNIVEFNYTDAIWLPLWCQCRRILSDSDLYLLLLTKRDNDIQINIWKHDSGHKASQRSQYLGMVRETTDLEAMYQVISLFVL